MKRRGPSTWCRRVDSPHSAPRVIPDVYTTTGIQPISSEDETMEAILKYKRKHPDGSGHDVVDLLCPNCENVSTIGYEGWSAIVCQGCGVELYRPDDFEDREYRSYPYYVATVAELMKHSVDMLEEAIAALDEELATTRMGVEPMGRLDFLVKQFRTHREMLERSSNELIPNKPF